MEIDFKEIYKELSKPFPKEAHSKDLSRGANNPMTSIKAQWIVERLNNVLGFNGWAIDGDIYPSDNGFNFKGYLTVFPNTDHEHKILAIGFAKHGRNEGDSRKSCVTDALSKSASKIGVGNDVFKGNVDPYTFDTKDTERDTLMKEVEEAAKKATKNFQDTEKMKLIKDTLEIDGAFVAFIKQLDNEDLKGVLTVIKGME